MSIVLMQGLNEITLRILVTAKERPMFAVTKLKLTFTLLRLAFRT
jgi:hypothetical protein